MRTLVFAPHPDDEILGCGGLMTLLVMRGSPVSVIYLTSGEAGSLDKKPAELAGIREEEARQGLAVLGITDLLFLNNPDGYLEYSRANLNNIVAIIREKKPELVLAPQGGDDHPDHRVTYQLVIEAVRRAAGEWFAGCGRDTWRVGQLLCYEVLTPLTHVSYVADITDAMDLKLAALRKHSSQLSSTSYDEAIMGLNRFRGVASGEGRFCECFQVERGSPIKRHPVK